MVDAINDKRDRNQFLFGLAQQGHALACCAVNVAEVYAGMRPKEEQRTTQLLRSLHFDSPPFPVAEQTTPKTSR